jgi:membrane-bound metal-dependent hydrolase YbcI (DUF457 family)
MYLLARWEVQATHAFLLFVLAPALIAFVKVLIARAERERWAAVTLAVIIVIFFGGLILFGVRSCWPGGGQ